MKRKQQFLKTANIFRHNQRTYNTFINDIRKELETKAQNYAYNLTEDTFYVFEDFNQKRKNKNTEAYFEMFNKRDYRRKRLFIRRGNISRYGNRKYLAREYDLRELKRYIKKAKSNIYKATRLSD